MRLCLFALTLPLALAAGCATRSDVVEAKVDIIKNDDSNRSQLSAEHLRIAQGDIEGLKTQIEDAKKRDDQLHAQLDEQRKQALERSEVLARIGSVVDQGLTSLAQGKGPIQVAIDAAAALAKSGAVERSQALVEAEAQKREAASKSLDDAMKSLSKDVDSKTESVRKEVQSLSRETLDLLTRMSKEAQESLRKAGELGPEQLRQAFLAEFAKIGASKEDLEKVRGMSPEALYALLALVLGGGAAGGKALSVFGKSRAADDLCDLNKSVTSLQSSLGLDGKQAKPYLDEIFDRLAALEQQRQSCDALKTRIETLERRFPS